MCLVFNILNLKLKKQIEQMRNILLYMCLVAFVIACQTSPSSKVYNEASVDADVENAVKERNLSEDQTLQVENYLNMARNEERVEELLTGKTYGQIIDDAMNMEMPVEEEEPVDIQQDSVQTAADSVQQVSADSAEVAQ